jgi:hypothetical protein
MGRSLNMAYPYSDKNIINLDGMSHTRPRVAASPSAYVMGNSPNYVRLRLYDSDTEICSEDTVSNPPICNSPGKIANGSIAVDTTGKHHIVALGNPLPGGLWPLTYMVRSYGTSPSYAWSYRVNNPSIVKTSNHKLRSWAVFDAQGSIHIIFDDNGLKYATHSGNPWLAWTAKNHSVKNGWGCVGRADRPK